MNDRYRAASAQEPDARRRHVLIPAGGRSSYTAAKPPPAAGPPPATAPCRTCPTDPLAIALSYHESARTVDR